MSKSMAISLVSVVMLGVAIVSIPVPDKEAIAAAPFWQLHGTAPSAAETPELAQIRLAVRQIAAQVVVAHRAR